MGHDTPFEILAHAVPPSPGVSEAVTREAVTSEAAGKGLIWKNVR
jgi:hypothetical protein